jgi:2-polyprenyl-3-methyl-5-hydroxy-6-metoxy-1,4-benzoquinol methylase
MTRDYVYEQGFAEERNRIAGMEALWDPGRPALLDELGIGQGWKCIEVGAGGGSLVEWMAGHGASVLAVGIDTRTRPTRLRPASVKACVSTRRS